MWTLRRILLVIVAGSSAAVVATLFWATATYERFAVETRNASMAATTTYFVQQRVDLQFLHKLAPVMGMWTRNGAFVAALRQNQRDAVVAYADGLMTSPEAQRNVIRVRNVVIYSPTMEFYAEASRGTGESLREVATLFEAQRNASRTRDVSGTYLWRTSEGVPVFSLFHAIVAGGGPPPGGGPGGGGGGPPGGGGGGGAPAPAEGRIGIMEIVADPTTELAGIGEALHGNFVMMDQHGEVVFDSGETPTPGTRPDVMRDQGLNVATAQRETIPLSITDRTGNPWATATLTWDTTEFRESIGQLRDKAIAMFAAVVLASIVIGWLLLRFAVLGRIREFAGAMDTLAGGDVDVRIPPTGPDEFATMGAALQSLRGAVRQRQKLQEEAIANAHAKSQFVAMVSHEIRTPMNGVLGMARLLRDTQLERDQAECADGIITAGESLQRLVDDLLDLSKLEAGALALESIPFLIEDVFDQTIAVADPRASEKRLQLTSEIDREIPPILVGDPFRLRQVLLNLVTNAVKFTDKGSVVLRADIAKREAEHIEIKFSVADSGKGIGARDKEKLFAPYTQASADVARKYGGTGLGLPICRRLVEMMGGDIGVDSALGKGSTFRFTVRFPIDRKSDPDAVREALSAATVIVAGPVTARPLTILQVEDNVTNRGVVDKTLTRAGHRVVNAANGIEALELIARQKFDLIVMDRHMPVMNGLDATRRIRGMLEPWRSLPILGVTAGARADEVAACLEAGMSECLTKPVHPARLLEAVARLCADAVPLEPATDRPVLVVDDVRVNLDVTRRQLKRLNIQAELMQDSVAALERAKDGSYAAIILDMFMPGIDGVTFAKTLREWEKSRGRHTPMIAVSGAMSVDDRALYREAGFDDFVAKPVAFQALAAALNRSIAPRADAVPAAPPAPVAAPAVDWPRLSEILGEDDEETLLGVLDAFIAAFPDLLATIERAVQGGDREAMRAAAHAAKGTAQYAAATELVDALVALERAVSGDDATASRVAAETVRPAFDRVVAFAELRRTAK